jgi:SAM-dependent methyltransferase
MFFPELIKSINANDKVLEIGPGASPYGRANEFLEYAFENEDQAIKQRGDVVRPPEFGGRVVTRYSGSKFPFKDNQFDYVIASHVIEHVEDPEKFMSEVYRVGGGRGYVEFPLPPYDYLFDFDVHKQFLWIDKVKNNINYVKKIDLDLLRFSSITSEMRRGLEMGWDDIVSNNLTYFFAGIEFEKPINIIRGIDFADFKLPWVNNGNTIGRRLSRKIEKLIK